MIKKITFWDKLFGRRPKLNTTFNFATKAQMEGEGMSVVIVNINSSISFSFNKIANPAMFPANINIFKNNEWFMVVAFPSTYIGQPFIIKINSTQYIGYFVDGTLKF